MTGLIPLGVCIVALAGCGSGAPSAAPLTNAVASSPAAGSGQDAGEPTSAEPSIPTVQPTAEAPTAKPTKKAGQCFDDLSSSDAKAGSSTNIKPYGTKMTSSSSGTKTAITVNRGKTVQADGIFGTDEGDQMLVFDVTGTLVSGSFGLVSYTQFSLWDTKGNACKPDLLSSAVKSDKRLTLTMLNSDEKAVSGKIAFEVPKGKDYSEFTLTWAKASSDEIAKIGWKG